MYFNLMAEYHQPLSEIRSWTGEELDAAIKSANERNNTEKKGKPRG